MIYISYDIAGLLEIRVSGILIFVCTKKNNFLSFAKQPNNVEFRLVELRQPNWAIKGLLRQMVQLSAR